MTCIYHKFKKKPLKRGYLVAFLTECSQCQENHVDLTKEIKLYATIKIPIDEYRASFKFVKDTCVFCMMVTKSIKKQKSFGTLLADK